MQTVQDKLKAYENQAYSYYESNDFINAEAACKEGLTISKQLENFSESNILAFKAQFYNLLGKIYQNSQKIKVAIEMYLDSIHCYNELIEDNENQHLPHLAETLISLGDLYSERGKYKEAIKVFLRALFINSKLTKNNSTKYLPNLAKIHTELGHLYMELKRIKEAKDSYSSALSIYKILSEKEPEKYNLYFITLTQILQVISIDS